MDGWRFQFATRGFADNADMQARRVNEEVGGGALALWFASALASKGVETNEPWQEDHGCDFSISRDGRSYLCVCVIEEDGAPMREAAILLTQQRSLMDRLKGAHKFDAKDPLIAIARELLASHPDIEGLCED